jgi:glycosyltransferase involved in cell wall biosynthesis
MLHIALLSTSYPDQQLGSEAAGSFVEDFAHALSERARVTVIAASAADSVLVDRQIQVRRFAVPRLPLSLLSPLKPTHWRAILQSLRAGRRALERLAINDRPDHVLALWALPSGYWAEQVAKMYGFGFSVWALGSDIWALSRVPVVRSILIKVLRRAEHCYADGLQLASDVEQLSGRRCGFLPSTRLLPVIERDVREAGAPRRLAFLGRWHGNKGVDLLLDAVSRLTDDDWSRVAELRIYGGGPLHEQVHAAVQRLVGQRRPVVVGGYLEKIAAAKLIAWADYLLLPSRIESIPVIFSDAMQLKTPIIATPVGDLPRLFEQHAVGVLAAKADANHFAIALQSALRRDAGSFADPIERAGREFDLARIARGFITDLEQASP